jgi:hypothetical protein
VEDIVSSISEEFKERENEDEEEGSDDEWTNAATRKRQFAA